MFLTMFPIRRAAWRFLSAPPAPFSVHTRGISFLTSKSLRAQSQTLSLGWQQRWASNVSNTDEVPITKLQPTPQEEVEDAILADNAARAADSTGEAPTRRTQTPGEVTSETGEANIAARVATGTVSEGTVSGGANESATSASGSRNTTSRGERLSGLRDAFTARDPDAAASDGRNQPKQTIYIGNLFFDVTEDDITKEVSRFGHVERVKLIRDARGLSKGFAYITFSSVEEATNAVSKLNQQLFEGRRLHVAYASVESPPTVRKNVYDKPQNPPSRTLFIGNMSWDMTDKDLTSMFKPIKGLIDVRVAIDRRTGQPRGFAHADFVDVKSAMTAFQELQGMTVNGRTLRLDYSYGPNSAPRNQARDKGDL